MNISKDDAQKYIGKTVLIFGQTEATIEDIDSCGWTLKVTKRWQNIMPGEILFYPHSFDNFMFKIL